MYCKKILFLVVVLTILQATLQRVPLSNSKKVTRRLVSNTDTGLGSKTIESNQGQPRRRISDATIATTSAAGVALTPEEEKKAKEKKEKKEEEEEEAQAIYLILASSVFFIIYILLASWLRSKGWMKLPSISVLIGFAFIGSWILYLFLTYNDGYNKKIPVIKKKFADSIGKIIELIIAPMFIADSFNEKCLMGARRDITAAFLFGLGDLLLTFASLVPCSYAVVNWLLYDSSNSEPGHWTPLKFMSIIIFPLVLCSTDRSAQAEVQRPLGNCKAFRTLLTTVSYWRFLACSSIGFTLWQITGEIALLRKADETASIASVPYVSIVCVSIFGSLAIGAFGGVVLSLISKYIKTLNEIPMYEMLGVTYMAYTVVSACYYHNWLNQMLALLVASAIICAYARFNWSRTTIFHIAYIFQTFAYVASTAINFGFGLISMGLMAASSIRHYLLAWVAAFAATALVLFAQILSHSITGAIGCCTKSFLSKPTFYQRVVLILSRQNYGTYFLVAFAYLPNIIEARYTIKIFLWNWMYNMVIISVFITSPVIFWASKKCREESGAKDDAAELEFYGDGDDTKDCVDKLNEHCLNPCLIRDYKNRKAEIMEIVTEQNKAVSSVMMKSFTYEKKATMKKK